MASAKNSDRRKRKYGDSQKSRTAKNKASAQARHERNLRRAAGRTDSLVGTVVAFGSKAEDKKGTVLGVVRKGDEEYPKKTDNFKPRGAYLAIAVEGEDDRLIARRSVRRVA